MQGTSSLHTVKKAAACFFLWENAAMHVLSFAPVALAIWFAVSLSQRLNSLWKYLRYIYMTVPSSIVAFSRITVIPDRM